MEVELGLRGGSWVRLEMEWEKVWGGSERKWEFESEESKSRKWGKGRGFLYFLNKQF